MTLHSLMSPIQLNKQFKINTLFAGFQKNLNLKKAWTSLLKVRAANAVCSHFTQYFAFEIADTKKLQEHAFKIRHQVYCQELKYEPIKKSGFEQDQFDTHSSYCLIKHYSSNLYAGTVRIVNSSSKHNEKLPIEQYCLDTITETEYSPSNFSRDEICEISRLAVPSIFAVAKSINSPGAATGTFNENTYSEKELRCFPFIAIGLYFSAASLALKSGKKHAFVMMEPRLARNMSFVGIKFKQIGPVVNYHGRRAPYYINADLLNTNLTRGFKTMLSRIQKKINSL